jgi:predicted dehydrogenase
MKSKPRRRHAIGFLGVGSRALGMIRCLQAVDRTRLVSAADTSPESRERARPRLPESCRLDDDPRHVLEDPEVELVYLSTPDNAHADLAVAAMEAGKAVLCEKPMATTIEDCDRIIAAVEGTGAFFAVTMQLRYSYWARVMKDLLSRGDLGGLSMMWCHEFRGPFRRDKVGDWIVYHDCSGGPFVEKNSHHWDLFDWWAGGPALRVHAVTRNTGIHSPGDVWDCGWANVEYAGGAIANLGLSMISPHGHGLKMGLIGTEGWAEGELTADGGTVRAHQSSSPAERVYRANLAAAEQQLGHAGSELPMIEAFLDALEAGEKPPTDCWWARESILVGIAAERSAAEGRIVELAELRRASAYPQATPYTG